MIRMLRKQSTKREGIKATVLLTNQNDQNVNINCVKQNSMSSSHGSVIRKRTFVSIRTSVKGHP